MSEQEELTELIEQIGQLLFYLQISLDETERQTCLLLLEELLRKYYDLKQTAGEQQRTDRPHRR
jgi:hypothetical protein